MFDTKNISIGKPTVRYEENLPIIEFIEQILRENERLNFFGSWNFLQKHDALRKCAITWIQYRPFKVVGGFSWIIKIWDLFSVNNLYARVANDVKCWGFPRIYKNSIPPYSFANFALLCSCSSDDPCPLVNAKGILCGQPLERGKYRVGTSGNKEQSTEYRYYRAGVFRFGHEAPSISEPFHNFLRWGPLIIGVLAILGGAVGTVLLTAGVCSRDHRIAAIGSTLMFGGYFIGVVGLVSFFRRTNTYETPRIHRRPKALENFERGMIALFKVPKLPIGKGRVGPAWSVQIQITDRRGCL
jgi:hypothetical protein